ncbi:MAG: hypothetical protein H6607_02945 [Flavobacteriales bacterium]|nr:hypothetical protein [Flavobacteriales bacterium]
MSSWDKLDEMFKKGHQQEYSPDAELWNKASEQLEVLYPVKKKRIIYIVAALVALVCVGLWWSMNKLDSTKRSDIQVESQTAEESKVENFTDFNDSNTNATTEESTKNATETIQEKSFAKSSNPKIKYEEPLSKRGELGIDDFAKQLEEWKAKRSFETGKGGELRGELPKDKRAISTDYLEAMSAKKEIQFERYDWKGQSAGLNSVYKNSRQWRFYVSAEANMSATNKTPTRSVESQEFGTTMRYFNKWQEVTSRVGVYKNKWALEIGAGLSKVQTESVVRNQVVGEKVDTTNRYFTLVNSEYNANGRKVWLIKEIVETRVSKDTANAKIELTQKAESANYIHLPVSVAYKFVNKRTFGISARTGFDVMLLTNSNIVGNDFNKIHTRLNSGMEVNVNRFHWQPYFRISGVWSLNSIYKRDILKPTTTMTAFGLRYVFY